MNRQHICPSVPQSTRITGGLEILAVVILSLTIPFTLLIERAFYGIETPPSLLLGALLVVSGILLVAARN